MTFSHFIFFQDSQMCQSEVSFEPLDLSQGLEQHVPVCKEEVSSGQQELNPSPQVNDEDEASSSIEMEKQKDVDDCGASELNSDDQLLFSSNNIMNYDQWEEAREVQAALSALKSRKRDNLEGQMLPLSNKLSYQELKPKQIKPMKIQLKKSKRRYKISIIPVSCTVCGKSVYDMNTHMEIHTGRKYFRYRCRICGEGFKHKGDYWPHYLKCIHCFHGTLYTGLWMKRMSHLPHVQILTPLFIEGWLHLF